MNVNISSIYIFDEQKFEQQNYHMKFLGYSILP